jgi:tetratricopeptide (TPR) repeat protein
LIALSGAVPTQLGSVVWALSSCAPWDDDEGVLEVCLRAPEVVSLQPGSRVLLRVRVEDLTWLNLYRPVFADRELRVVLWISYADLNGLMRQAVDFFDWVSRIISVPSKPLPDFAVAGVRAALEADAAFSWRGELLDEVLDASGADEDRVAIRADRPYREMLEALSKPGLVIVSGIRSERDAWRVRMALAQAGRGGSWVAVDPRVELPGMWSLHARQADWDHAANQLAALGWARPGLVAAWLELEPERIEAARGHPNAPPPDPSEWGPERVAIADAPAFILRQRAADTAVAAAREALALGTLPSGEGARVTWSAGRRAWIPGDETDTSPAMLVRRIHHVIELDAGVPTEEVIDDAQTLGFEDVALELALVRAKHNQRVRPDQIVAWLAVRGRTQDAIGWCERWMESARQQGTIDTLLSALGWAGDLHLKTGESERAQQYFEDGEALAEQLARSEPTKAHKLQNSRFSARLGDIYRLIGETNRARACHEDSLITRERLLAAEPEDVILQRAVADAHQRVGDICRALGDLDAADRHYRSSLALLTRLQAEQPRNQSWHEDALASLDRIAAIHAETGQREQAIERYESALSDYQRLVDLDPSNLARQANLAISSNSLGTVHFQAERFELAKTHHEQALHLLSALVGAEPRRVDWLGQLSMTYNKLGDVYLATGESGPARMCYERALAQREDLVEREPRRADFAHRLAVSYGKLGDVHLAIGGREQARGFFKLSVEVTEQVVARDPNDYQLRRHLSGSYQRMAIVDDSNARSWLNHAIAMLRQCLQQAPRDVATKHDLGLALSQLGVVLREHGDEANADAAVREATALLGTLEPRVTLSFGGPNSDS